MIETKNTLKLSNLCWGIPHPQIWVDPQVIDMTTIQNEAHELVGQTQVNNKILSTQQVSTTYG